MRRDSQRLILLGVLGAFSLAGLIGCAQKKVKVDAAEEMAVIKDTAGAKSEEGKKAGGADDSTVAKTDSTAASEGAGAAEPLETPPGQDASAMSGAGHDGAGVVPGSRTDLGFLPVFFDFDKAIIRQDQVERIAVNANFLKENPALKVRIEGNCDERGTNEYNLALGERRAMSTMKYLVNLGVADSRVSVLSYGEERPINLGHDETAWTENRRGDFVIAQ